jgi:hypothetical protein
MRHPCRLVGKPAFHETKHPSSYNARRASLESFWKGQFGHIHGVIVCDAYCGNVSRQRSKAARPPDTEENVVLEFKPQPRCGMSIFFFYLHWKNDSYQLWSFAAISDESPPEVAAAVHDRCIIPIWHEYLGTRFDRDPNDLEVLHAISDDRQRSFYGHRMAA